MPASRRRDRAGVDPPFTRRRVRIYRAHLAEVQEPGGAGGEALGGGGLGGSGGNPRTRLG